MKRFTSALVMTLTFVMAVGLFGTATMARGSKGDSKTTDPEFRELIAQYYKAWSKLSSDAPARFYAKDAELIFYDVAPMKYHGWAEYKAGVQKNIFDNATSTILTPNDDLKVTRRGTVAWTTVTFHLSAKFKNGQSLDVDARHTAIWEKKKGTWLIVHEHVSAPLPG